jgi:hypothetical protein
MSETPSADLPVRETVLLAAFEGWNDAGSAATQALEHLHEVWDAEHVDELDPEEYHDFQVNRPVVGPGADGRREITWPTTAVAVATAPVSGRRVVLVHGIEPSMRWRRYCTELPEIAAGLGVDTVVTVGALLADVPHTRPIPVNATSEDAGVRDDFRLEPNTYEGPTGIVGVLHDALARAGVESASLWAAVPSYVPSAPSPKAQLALVERTAGLLDVGLVTTDLEIASASYERQVTELVEADDDTAAYVRHLEESQEDEDVDPADFVAEVERFLRDQRDS